MIADTSGAAPHQAQDEALEATLAKLQIRVSEVLRYGSTISAIIVAVGLLFYLAVHHSGYAPGAFPRSLPAEWRGLRAGKPYAVILLGLLILMATPFLRVTVSLITFVGAGDWKYTAVTGIVLAVLILSFTLGRVL